MVKHNLYLSVNGRLHRKESTIYYYTKEGKRVLPVDQIKAIFAVGRISVTSGVISFLSKQGLPLHFFGYYGNYEGSFYPKRRLVSGYAVVNQAAAHLDRDRRLEVAKAIVDSCISNMVSIVDSYHPRVQDLNPILGNLNGTRNEVKGRSSVPELLSVEGRAWSIYYDAFEKIIKKLEMGPRVKRPPNNPVNALISLGNSLL